VDGPAIVPEISALQLALTLQSANDLQVIDVRPPALVAAGRIDLVPAHRFHSIVGSRLMNAGSLIDTGLDPSLPITVVCGHGHDSRIVAHHLNEIGGRASSLRGGMAAWMTLVVGRDLAPPPSLDRFVQFDRLGKGALGYLLVADGEALVVDPPRDATAYLDAAHDAGARIVGVADTHIHADYISGAPVLARALQAPYYLHADDALSPYDGTPGRIDFCAIEDGSVIHIGRCALRVVHTPGHTEGSVCYVIGDAAALTGDFIFVVSVGRPDLAGKTTEWTADLWRSLQWARRAWPDALTICPAHYASAGERRPDGVVAAPFGAVVRGSEAFDSKDKAAFGRWVSARTGAFPDTYRTIKAVNLGLANVDDRAAEELEIGRNQCALAGALNPALPG
jgi:glyoxylase-like metal-dependent hydrolase (beta-lactamase superfamily II)